VPKSQGINQAMTARNVNMMRSCEWRCSSGDDDKARCHPDIHSLELYLCSAFPNMVALRRWATREVRMLANQGRCHGIKRVSCSFLQLRVDFFPRNVSRAATYTS
jgi:hypothetical protein